MDDEKISSPAEDGTSAVKEKKRIPVMRLFISFLAGLAALAIFWGVYFFVQNRAVPEMADYAGDYALVSARSGETTMDKADSAELFSLTLAADGKCRLYTEEKSYAGRWTLRGESVSIKCAGLELGGVISDTSLRLNNVLTGGLYVELDRISESAEEASAPLPGTYRLTCVESGETVYSAAAVTAAGYDTCYIKLSFDSTGEALLFDADAQEISCTEDYVVYKDMALPFEKSGSTLKLSYPGGITLIFDSKTR